MSGPYLNQDEARADARILTPDRDRIAALDSEILALRREVTLARGGEERATARAVRAEDDLREARRFAEGLARDLEAARAGAIRAEVAPETVDRLRSRDARLDIPESRAALEVTCGDVKRAEALVFLIRRLR